VPAEQSQSGRNRRAIVGVTSLLGFPRTARRFCLGWAALVFAAVLSGPAFAQLVLPGAVVPSPEGTVHKPQPVHPRPRPSAETENYRPVPMQTLSASSLAAKTLSLNGGKSQIMFEARDKGVEVTHLSLAGELISNPLEACQIETPNMPLAVSPVARQDGIERIQINFPACPITFDVLNGGALVEKSQAVCEFQQANCRVNPAGLWGPQSGDLGPDKVKELEHVRAVAEATVRTTFKALVASTKDKLAIMGYAREQAQFSSTREETCRDYAGEGRHGFCAARVTEARAVTLRSKLADSLEAKAERKAKRHRPGQAVAKP
jgi:hypothetical protein